MNLFDRRGPAEIVPFPRARSRAIVMRIAHALAGAPDYDTGKAIWQAETKRMRAELRRAGFTPSEAKREVEALAKAVNPEVRRIEMYGPGYGRGS